MPAQHHGSSSTQCQGQAIVQVGSHAPCVSNCRRVRMESVTAATCDFAIPSKEGCATC